MKTRSQQEADYKTEQQWAKLGKLVQPGQTGEKMWSNGFRSQAIYYRPEQVYSASADELNEFFKPIRQRRREAAKKRSFQRQQKVLAELQQGFDEKVSQLQQDFEKKMSQMAAMCCETSMEMPAIPCHNRSGIIVIDTETTGLSSMDEILQLSIVDGEANVLLDQYVQPYYKEAWPEAQAINDISPEMIQGMPYLHELIPQLQGIIDAAHTLVFYNAEFDLGMLSRCGDFSQGKKIVDVMTLFAPVYGEWSEKYDCYKWQKLQTCAQYFGYQFKAHNSLNDAQATLHCYNSLMNLFKEQAPTLLCEPLAP